MLDVFLTVDVEVWCDGWDDIDAKFPQCFRKYVYGPTAAGDYGLPYQLKLLREHGLTGVFFTEPLFSTRFGRQPLADIVGLLRDGGGQVELHLLPEWGGRSDGAAVGGRYPQVAEPAGLHSGAAGSLDSGRLEAAG